MLNDYLHTAVAAARAAGEFLLPLAEIGVSSAEGKDIKLHADKESEKILLSRLRPTGIPILSEESAEACDWRSGPRWIIDPIDGSYNLFKGLRDLCCVSVALWEDATPKLGVVYRFAQNDLYIGLPGRGATLNGREIRGSQVTRVSQASLATGFPVTADFSDSGMLERFTLLKHFKKIRMLGTAALMCALVGQGCLDVYSEKGILLWDVAAALAVVQAAGGSYECEFLDDWQCNVTACGNAELARDLAATLAGGEL